MSDMSLMFAEPQTEAEAEEVYAQILAEFERLNAMMRADDIEIARLRAESQAIKEESAAIKAETAQLKTRAERRRKEDEASREEMRALLKRLEANLYPC